MSQEARNKVPFALWETAYDKATKAIPVGWQTALSIYNAALIMQSSIPPLMFTAMRAHGDIYKVSNGTVDDKLEFADGIKFACTVWGMPFHDREFNSWLQRMVSEKELDTEHLFVAEGPLGVNVMSLHSVLKQMENAYPSDQEYIRKALLYKDFYAEPFLNYFEELAKVFAL